MSAETLRGVEDAIRAHFEDTLDGDSTTERRGAVIINWVVGYTLSNIIDIGDEQVVGYTNEYIASSSDPNAQAHLARWTSRQIANVLEEEEETP